MNEPTVPVRTASPPAGGAARLAYYLRKQWLRCLLLGLIGFSVRLPALQGEPIWDDGYLAKTNPFIKSPLLVLEVFRHHLFPESYSSHYRPVQNISYMADYLVWNGNFYGFHLSNILYHVGAGILLYFLLGKLLSPLLGRSKHAEGDEASAENSGVGSWLAFFVALLWVVHPVHSAAIDYVSGRADSLGVFFGCAGWLLFLKAREGQNRWLRGVIYFFAWFSGLLALCARENAALWPILFLVYLFVFERPKISARRWIIVAACVVMFASYLGLRHLPEGRPAPGGSSNWPVSMHAVLMLRSLGDYGRLMIFPANLHMERTVFAGAAISSEKVRQESIANEYLSIAGLLVLATLFTLASRGGAGQRIRIFGAAWFLMTYLPISNVVELNATVAEHWLYLPSVGFLIFAAGCAVDLPRRWHRATMALASVAVLALGIRSAIRSSDWQSNEIFARRTIAAGGASIRVALLLGQVYLNREDYPEAERLFRKALQMCPEYPTARNNLATALVKQGKEKEADALFTKATADAREARKDYPRTWIAALNLARMRHDQKDEAAALEVLRKARQDYPGTWELVRYQCELLREAGKLDESLATMLPFAEENWWHHDAWMATGRLYAQKGENDAAASALHHASWLDIHETEALNLLAVLRMSQNRFPEACRAQKRAVSRQPDQPQQYILLSNILDKMGRGDESRDALAHVTRLRSLVGVERAAN